jgi:hypothetical protein
MGKQLNRVSPAITADGMDVMKDLGSEVKRKGDVKGQAAKSCCVPRWKERTAW